MDNSQNSLLASRGFATVYLIGAIVVAAAVAGAYFFGRSDGEDLERSRWVNQQNQDLREANQEILRLTAEVKAKERNHAERLAKLSRDYEQGLQDARNEADNWRSRLSEYYSLRERPTTSSPPNKSVSRAPTSTRKCDGPPAARLDREHGEFLITYAAQAHALAKQLIACQEIVRSDRQLR